MSARTIFSLIGRIGLDGMQQVNKDIASAEKSIKVFQKELGKLGKNLTRIGSDLSKNLTLPLAAAGTAIAALSLKTSEYASKILSMSEATGLSTDTLQEFENVARKAGVSSDALLNTTQQLRNRMDGIRSGTGDAAEAMDKLGISVTNSDGSLRDMNDMFPQILGELNKIENTTERNALASKLFGKSMSDLAPVLAMTADELSNVRKEAHESGRVMAKDALVNADEFRISVANLKAEFGVMTMQIASSFIPILQNQLIPLIYDKVVPALMGAAGAVKGLAEWFGNFSPSLQNTILIVAAVVAAIGPLVLVGGKAILMFKGLIGSVFGLTGAAIGATKASAGLTAALYTKLNALAKTTLSLGAATAATKTFALSALATAKTAVISKGAALGSLTTILGGVKIAIAGATTAIKAMSVALLANPLGAAIVATAALTAGVWALVRSYEKLKEVETRAADDESHMKSMRMLSQRTMAARKSRDEYEKLRGSEKFDPAEMERRQTAFENLNIVLQNTERTHKGMAKMNDEEVASMRRRLRGMSELTNESNKAESTITDFQRAEMAKRAETARKANEQRIKDLSALVQSHRDAIDKIIMNDIELLAKEEQIEINKAKALKASGEEDIASIRAHYSLRRTALIEKEYEEQVRAWQDEIDELDESMKKAEKIRLEANAKWQSKLQTQNDDLVLARHASELEAAKKNGDDLLVLQTRQTEERFAIRERQRKAAMADDLAAAAESGADVEAIHQYYATVFVNIEREKAAEIKNIEAEITEEIKRQVEKRNQLVLSMVNFTQGAFNKLGSIAAGFSRNEEMRLDRQYKERRKYIEQNVEDEESRAAQLTALDEEQEAKKLAIQKDNAAREKSLGIFNAIINTATAITKALTAGPVAGPVMASIIAALGAAEISVIASTPQPFAVGGIVGGNSFGGDKIDARVNSGEMILTRQQQTRLFDLANGAGAEASPAASTNVTNVNLHVGTLVADRNGLLQLERKLHGVRISENTRLGVS